MHTIDELRDLQAAPLGQDTAYSNEIEGVGKRIRLDKHPNRFERMKKTHPKIYDYCMKPVSEGGQALDWSDEDE